MMQLIESKRRLFLSCLLLVSSITFGENRDLIKVENDSVTSIMEDGLKSLIDMTIISPNDKKTTPVTPIQKTDTIDSISNTEVTESEIYSIYNTYNRLNMPLQFSRPYFTDVWKIEEKPFLFDKEIQGVSIEAIKSDVLTNYLSIDSIRKEIIHNIIFKHPEWVESNQKSLPKDFVIGNVRMNKHNQDLLEGFFNPNFAPLKNDSTHHFKIKANTRGHWYSVNKTAIQFSQNYISTNWQQGGESNLSMIGQLNMKANYINPRGWTLYNDLEWRASFYTAPSDTVRSWRVSDDLFRVSSNLAIKASEKWNYSVATEFKTRFFNAFKTNSDTKLASFLSPAELSIGVGMSYENDFPKLNISGLSLLLSPYSYNWKYVMNNNVDETRYGIDKGKSTLKQIGSRLDLKLNYKMNKNVTWGSRFYYFTTYESVESEWENTINFVINRYFSTRIFFHIKYNDKRILKNGEDSYLQFKELISFGLNYAW